MKICILGWRLNMGMIDCLFERAIIDIIMCHADSCVCIVARNWACSVPALNAKLSLQTILLDWILESRTQPPETLGPLALCLPPRPRAQGSLDTPQFLMELWQWSNMVSASRIAPSSAQLFPHCWSIPPEQLIMEMERYHATNSIKLKGWEPWILFTIRKRQFRTFSL